MNKLFAGSFVFAAALALFSAGARASTMDNVVITSTYTSTTSSSPFSAASQSVSLSFSLPDTLPSNLSETGVTVTVQFNGVTTQQTGQMEFFPSNNLGLLDVAFVSDANVYEWDFFGAQQVYNSSTDMLVTGNYAIYTSGAPAVPVFYINGISSGNLSGGTVSITSETTPPTVPEPSSLVLLGTGLLGLAAVVRFARL